MDQSGRREQERSGAFYCHWHPGTETGLYCSQCGKHICTQCMVQAPVGIRCRECGKTVPLPTFDVSPSYYARAISVAAAGGIAGGLLWALVNAIFRGIPFLPSLAAVAVGYGLGELISLAVNRKRGKGLAWIAACSVVLAFIISWSIGSFPLSIFSILFLGLGVYGAVVRVR